MERNLTGKNSGFLYSSIGLTHSGKHLSKIVFNMLYRFRSKGIKNIPQEPCILVANHQSALDGLFITSMMKRKLYGKTYFFAKEKHWRSGIMQFMARKNNVILMDINKNVRETMQKLSYVLQEGKNVIIFPEGTRSKNGIKDFKETFAILSTVLNIPVVPVVIYGSDQATYRKVKLPRYFTPVTVEFLQPVYPHSDETFQSLKDRVKELIASRLNRHLNKGK